MIPAPGSGDRGLLDSLNVHFCAMLLSLPDLIVVVAVVLLCFASALGFVDTGHIVGPSRTYVTLRAPAREQHVMASLVKFPMVLVGATHAQYAVQCLGTALCLHAGAESRLLLCYTRELDKEKEPQLVNTDLLHVLFVNRLSDKRTKRTKRYQLHFSFHGQSAVPVKLENGS